MERKTEVDSEFRKSETHPPQNTETESVSLIVENPVSGSEQPTEPPSILDKNGSFLICGIPIPKPFCYLICFLLCVCFAPVAYVILTVATVGILPLLLAAFVFVRLFQIIVSYKNIFKNFTVKALFQYWIFVVVILLLVEVGLFYPIAKYAPGLKLVLIIGLPITKWIEIICILIGIYLMSQFIWMAMVFVLSTITSAEGDWCLVLLELTSDIIGCLLLLWAEVIVMNSVPTFNQSNIFGIRTRKWIKVSLFVLIGYNIITLLTQLLVWSLPKIYGHRPKVGESFNDVISVVCCDEIGKGAINQKYVVYVASGIKRSIIFILSMVMLLIIWMVYFGNRLDTTPQDQRVLDVGTWTMVCILIWSFLWLIKSCVRLYWEARFMYDRLHSKITAIGKQLYFLIMLSHTHYQEIIEFPVEDSNDDCGLSCSKTPPKKKAQWVILDTNAEGEIPQMLDRKSVRAELINHIDPKALSTFDIQKAAELFLSSHYALSKESIIDDLKHLQGDDESGENNTKCIETLKKIVLVDGENYFDKDWELLLKLIPDCKTTEEITFQKVKLFMERARYSCMFLSNTLISERDVVNCLNEVIRWIIVAGIFIMWLLVSGFATTKLLVAIASPFLAVTFIFGDTAKSLFQGLIYVYVVHPFDVGDLCLIDEKLLEVRRIGVWCTIFSSVRAIGEQQQVIYPNSVLALKYVINHKTNFNWSDQIEFVSSPNKKITETVKHKIETYLDQEKEKFVPNFHSVEILEIGDKAKIVVHIKHKLPTTDGWNYFECLKAKEKRKFELAIYVQNLVKEVESEAKTPESLTELEQQPTRG